MIVMSFLLARKTMLLLSSACRSVVVVCSLQSHMTSDDLHGITKNKVGALEATE